MTVRGSKERGCSNCDLLTKSDFQIKINHDKMAEPKNKITCRYFNTGFCKFEGKCRFFHAKAVCSNKVCKENNCQSCHPRLCRYKERCKRKSSFLYRHVIRKTEKKQVNVEYEKC